MSQRKKLLFRQRVTRPSLSLLTGRLIAIASIFGATQAIACQGWGDSIFSPPSLTTFNAQVGVAFSQTFSDPVATSYSIAWMDSTFSTSGPGMADLTFSSATTSSALAGTPTQAGAWYFQITSYQAGGTCASGPASYTLDIAKGNQTLAFTSAAPTTAIVGGSYTVTATGGASGSAVTFSIDPASTFGACTLAGGTVAFTGAGTCLIDANQTGDPNYIAAAQAQQSITIGAKPVPTPMLNHWVLLLLGGLCGGIALTRMRRA